MRVNRHTDTLATRIREKPVALKNSFLSFTLCIFRGPRRLSSVARASHSSRSRSRVRTLGTLGSGLHGVSREAGRGIRSKVRAMPYDPRPLTLSIPPTRLRPARILSLPLSLPPFSLSFSYVLLLLPQAVSSSYPQLCFSLFLSFSISPSFAFFPFFFLSQMSAGAGSRTMRVIHVCKACA